MWQFSFSVSLNGEAGTVGLPAGTVMPVVYKKAAQVVAAQVCDATKMGSAIKIGT
ncbi:MAG TPA: hypothetical protein PKM63_03635 [Panacibacter sp.]|nr:hypothetical protein [Panacibacter sp.]HNP43349.1 hypothetical protein [Panacibacter sp.]